MSLLSKMKSMKKMLFETFPNLTFKDDRGPSTLQRIQILRRYHGLSVPSYDQAVRVIIKNALVALHSSRDGAEPLAELKKVCEANKTKPEAWLKASEDKLSDAQHRVQEIELINDTASPLAAEVNEAEKALPTSQEHAQFDADRIEKQTNQLLAKDAEAAM